MTDPKQKAFTEAYARCHEPFMRYCSALAFGKMDVEDLVQDVLLSAYRNFENIEKKDQLLHYLMRAARNRFSSFWRKPRYDCELLEKHSERLVSRGASPEVLIDVQLLYKTLDRLPESQRQALVMFEISGFSMKEIAEIQGSNEGAVKTKISRGRQKLRALLEDDHEQPSVSHLLKTVQSIAL